jgi:hypothetical protein
MPEQTAAHGSSSTHFIRKAMNPMATKGMIHDD